jgi:hypothetical protein
MSGDARQKDYKDIAVLKKEIAGGDRVISSITSRQFGSVTRFSFCIMKEYDGKGVGASRSHWLDRRHIAAIRALLDETEARLIAEESPAVGKRGAL